LHHQNLEKAKGNPKLDERQETKAASENHKNSHLDGDCFFRLLDSAGGLFVAKTAPP